MSAEARSGPVRNVVLVVDEEVLVRYVICDYLRECGYRVVEAANAVEALQVLQESDVGVDVILNSVQLPGSTAGFSLARWVRAHRPEIGVILVGTVPQAADAAAELCEEGPMLARPYEPQAVVDRIKRLLAERDRA